MPPKTREERLREIENSFTYHSPHGTQPTRYAQLREKAKELAIMYVDLVPDGRYQALAITHLEISSAMANKGIACDEPGPAPGTA